MEVHNLETLHLGIDFFMKEIGGIVAQAADQGRDELNWEEIEFIKKYSNRFVKEANMELADVAYLLPEVIPQETVVQILKDNGEVAY